MLHLCFEGNICFNFPVLIKQFGRFWNQRFQSIVCSFVASNKNIRLFSWQLSKFPRRLIASSARRQSNLYSRGGYRLVYTGIVWYSLVYAGGSKQQGTGLWLVQLWAGWLTSDVILGFLLGVDKYHIKRMALSWKSNSVLPGILYVDGNASSLQSTLSCLASSHTFMYGYYSHFGVWLILTLSCMASTHTFMYG